MFDVCIRTDIGLNPCVGSNPDVCIRTDIGLNLDVGFDADVGLVTEVTLTLAYLLWLLCRWS